MLGKTERLLSQFSGHDRVRLISDSISTQSTRKWRRPNGFQTSRRLDQFNAPLLVHGTYLSDRNKPTARANALYYLRCSSLVRYFVCLFFSFLLPRIALGPGQDDDGWRNNDYSDGKFFTNPVVSGARSRDLTWRLRRQTSDCALWLR